MSPRNNKPTDKASIKPVSPNANGPKLKPTAAAPENQNAGPPPPNPGENANSPPMSPEGPLQNPAQSADHNTAPQPQGEETDQVAALKAQIEDLTKRLLTAHADIQNLHKRFDRERKETEKYAITKFARDTVAVADNFERAITSVPKDATNDNPVLKALLDGVIMTEREFLNVLERHGVKRDSPLGESFDPHRHQAVMEENNPDVTSGTILKVFQPGYVMAERVLRPAMVVIAKGGPKAPKEETMEGEQPSDSDHLSESSNIPPEDNGDGTAG